MSYPARGDKERGRRIPEAHHNLEDAFGGLEFLNTFVNQAHIVKICTAANSVRGQSSKAPGRE